jgi:transcriptional regulator NrdR family protein
MWCPREACKSRNVTVRKTWRADDGKLAASLRGLNINRRQIHCNDCGNNFTSIEMWEHEFDEMRRPRPLDPAGLLRPFRQVKT